MKEDTDYDRLEDDFPRAYKAWVFGTKLGGVVVFAVGLEMLLRGHFLWSAGLLVTSALVVLAPVRGPGAWRAWGRGGTV